MTKEIKLTDSEKQKIAQTLIDREGIYCVSGLVEKCLEKEIMSWEDVENLYVLKCPKCGESKEFETDFEEAQEIFEWYIISKWLYEKLKEKGEPVLSYEDFNYFWGRTTTGQSVCLDNVIQDLAEELRIKAD